MASSHQLIQLRDVIDKICSLDEKKNYTSKFG